MKLLTLPPGTGFLPSLAALWRDHAAPTLSDGLILLPTRRAARGLAAAFLDAAQGAPLLLPRIVALGGLDEAPLALAGALDLPPAIGAPHRTAELARLILALPPAMGGPRRSDAAWALAGDLATLMDEAERAEIDLKAALERAADPGFAEHWTITLDFMRIVTEHWPAHLAEQGLMNPAARQVRLLDAQCEAWLASPPDHPVLAIGNAGDIPAAARLLRAVAHLPRGLVVLPGLDCELPDSVWDRLDAAHPQSGLQALLGQMGATRGDVRVHGPRPDRAALLAAALLPAPCLAAWQDLPPPPLDGLSRLHAADVQEEAVAIALILRDALEVPGAQAALVTPDRALAERVAAELGRWGVLADDSAGEKLAQTPPAVFLRLLAACVAARLAPVPLLSLLKHPLAAAGLPPAALRARARDLERACLRGAAPLPGLAGLRRALDRRHPDGDRPAEPDALDDLLARLEACLEPLLRAASLVVIPPADAMAALIAAAEALAATDDTPGPARLWGGEDGAALAELLAEIAEALPVLPAEPPDTLAPLLDALLAGAVVRSRRATRGHGGPEHPRIAIWGLLEARLQTADVIVLGGLAEGVWPAASDPGPWMSRPMRARAGLPSAELRVGQAAHDFCMAACAAPVAVLSAPRRRDGAPAVASRWLIRLRAMLGGATLEADRALPAHPAAAWAGLLDQPAGGAVPATAPRPCPPQALRPRRLAVTEIATLVGDPYEIYARHVLHLRPLDPLEQSADFRDYGSIVHQGLDQYLTNVGVAWPDDAAAALAVSLHQALRAAGVREALIAWWSPRLHRIAAWVDAAERTRRSAHPLALLAPEASGSWTLQRPGGPFTLRGRADRIELRADGGIAILDYKTGTLPSKTAAADGREPQLLLEAAMVEAGAFGPALAGRVRELTYWRLTGDHQQGDSLTVLATTDTDGITIAADEAADHLARLIDAFDDPHATYPAQPIGGRGHRSYAQLSRAAEWGAAEDDDAELTEP